MKPLKISAKKRAIESDELESELEFSELQRNGDKKNKRPMSQKETPVARRLWLEYLESSSSSDSDCDSIMTVDDVTKSAPTKLSLPFNEAIRQALLATSDSDSVSEIEYSTEKNSSDESSDALEIKGIGVKKSHVVDLTTDKKQAVETGNAKDDKLLHMDLDDPDAEPKKIKKKSSKKKRRSISSSNCNSQSSESEVEKRKRKKRRLNPSDSEDAHYGDDDSDEAVKSSKLRHRTSTSNSDNSGDSDTDILNESQPSEAGGSKGRKNIKKIMKETSLKVNISAKYHIY
jgi:hypothetical protein